MKFYSLGLIGLLSFFGFQPRNNATDTLHLTLEMQGCGNTLYLFQFDGIKFEKLQADEAEDNAFSFKIPKSEHRFYYVGAGPSQTLPVILGTEDEVKIKGNCSGIRNAEILNSPVNEGYIALKAKMDGFNAANSQYIRRYRAAAGNAEKIAAITESMKKLDEQKLAFLDSLQKANPYFAKIAALNTFLSYQNNGEGYDNEVAYFADNFFALADLKDEAYDYNPWVFESFKSYALTLAGVGLPEEVQKVYLDKMLARMTEAGPAQKMALGGILNSLQRKNSSNYLYFANKFIETYREKDPEAVADLESRLSMMRSLMVGGEAPDFTQKTPEGAELSLSDLRGKVVLVDFWASWCGPCRKENPNVVKMYEKYKGKGFEILGVSLDKTQDRWLQAIEQDGLTWKHVSDLKGWQNAVAQAYSVTSIPHTILLDQEGRIIARGLRGRALEQKLEELFD